MKKNYPFININILKNIKNKFFFIIIIIHYILVSLPLLISLQRLILLKIILLFLIMKKKSIKSTPFVLNLNIIIINKIINFR